MAEAVNGFIYKGCKSFATVSKPFVETLTISYLATILCSIKIASSSHHKRISMAAIVNDSLNIPCNAENDGTPILIFKSCSTCLDQGVLNKFGLNTTISHLRYNQSVFNDTSLQLIIGQVEFSDAGTYLCMNKRLHTTIIAEYNVTVRESAPLCEEQTLNEINSTSQNIARIFCTLRFKGVLIHTVRWLKLQNSSNYYTDEIIIKENAINGSISTYSTIRTVECTEVADDFTCEIDTDNYKNVKLTTAGPSSQARCALKLKSECATTAVYPSTLTFDTSEKYETMTKQRSPDSAYLYIISAGIGATTLCATVVVVAVCIIRQRRKRLALIQEPVERKTDEEVVGECYEEVQFSRLPDVAKVSDTAAAEVVYAQANKPSRSTSKEEEPIYYQDMRPVKPNKVHEKKSGNKKQEQKTTIGPLDGTVYAVLDASAKPTRAGKSSNPPKSSAAELTVESAIYAPIIHES